LISDDGNKDKRQTASMDSKSIDAVLFYKLSNHGSSSELSP
jgi:hypothetical protein